MINFHRPPKLRPAHDHQCLVAVVTNLSNSSLTPAQSIVVPQELRDTINIPSLTLLSDMTSTKQDFYCLSENAHNKLIRDYPMGLRVGKDYAKDVDTCLLSYSSKITNLLSLNKVSNVCSRLADKKFDGYVRIFAGDGAPLVDDTFEQYTVEKLQIHCKFVGARVYSEHPPLSIGLFHTPFQGTQINSNFISKLEKCLGEKRHLPQTHKNYGYIANL